MKSVIVFFFLFPSWAFASEDSFSTLKLDAHPLMWPDGCMKKAGPCTVKTGKGKKLRWEMPDLSITLGEESIVNRKSAQVFEFVKGVLYINSFETIWVETEYGKVRSDSGRFIVSRTANKVELQSIDARLKVYPKGQESPSEVPPAYQYYISQVTDNGVAETDILQVVEFRPFLHRWGQLYAGGTKDFRKDLQSFYQTWTQAVETLSQLYKERAEANRFLASEREKKQKLRLKRIQEENKRLLELFKMKNHLL